MSLVSFCFCFWVWFSFLGGGFWLGRLGSVASMELTLMQVLGLFVVIVDFI